MIWPIALLMSVTILCSSLVLAELIKARQSRLIEQDSRPGCRACRHGQNLEVVDAQPLTSKAGELQYNQTIVLKRCRACGVHYHYCHPGVWTTEDFLKRQADLSWIKEQIG